MPKLETNVDEEGNIHRTILHSRGIAAFSPEFNQIYVGGEGFVKVLNFPELTTARQIDFGEEMEPSCIFVNKELGYIVLEDSTFLEIDKKDQIAKSFTLDKDVLIKSLEYHSKKKTLLCGTANGKILVVDVEQQKVVQEVTENEEGKSVNCLLIYNKFLYSADSAGYIKKFFPWKILWFSRKLFILGRLQSMHYEYKIITSILQLSHRSNIWISKVLQHQLLTIKWKPVSLLWKTNIWCLDLRVDRSRFGISLVKIPNKLKNMREWKV